ncbi:MAG: tellurite resistance TerB C-terminal domain-containing protein, partial [Mycobacteriales bacterium]
AKNLVTKAEAVALTGLLAKCGVGVEPDVRFGGKTPTPGSTVMLFPLPVKAPTAPSSEYAAAVVLLHLAAVVASADGSITDAERRRLTEHLQVTLELDAPERVRLEAHLAWLTRSKPSLVGVKKRLDKLGDAQRGAVGRFLIGLAAADGAVSPEELTTLTKIYLLLGLDESDVYRTVHALGADSGPVTVQTSDLISPRWALPEPQLAPGRVRLDPATIQARLAETATVSALLAGIFTEGAESTSTVTTPPVLAADLGASAGLRGGAYGLDTAHGALADRLRHQPVWARVDAENLAAALDLPLLGGAIDRINEAAIDACGEPLIDGDDPLDINDYAAKELIDARHV